MPALRVRGITAGFQCHPAGICCPISQYAALRLTLAKGIGGDGYEAFTRPEPISVVISLPARHGPTGSIIGLF